MNEYRVYLVDDDAALCEALGYLLKSENLAVETFHSAKDFLDHYSPSQPAVLILDIRMRGMDGLELQQYLLDRGYRIPVIILSGHGDIPMAVKATKGGAVDFLQKPVNDQALFNRLHQAIELDKKNRVLNGRLLEIEKKISSLTPREHEVMTHVVDGMANKQIADLLSVSEKTIEVHRKHVMRKMSASSSIDLVSTVLWYRDRKVALR